MLAYRALTRRLLVAFAMTAAASGAVALPEMAAAGTTDPCPSYLYEGDDLRTLACYSWRGTYVFDDGRYQYTGRDDIGRYQHVYTRYGFPSNFTWYSHDVYRTFRRGPDSHVKWASCRGTSNGGYPSHELDWDRAGSGRRTGLCTDRIVTAEEQTQSLLDLFERSEVTLRVLEYEGAFIAMECGNFSARPTATQIPVPTISGSKFDDVNWNGHWDSGEPSLGGWEMRLFRDSSLVGQPTGDTGARATTGPDGRYRFALDGLGPGTYHVEEVQQPGYTQTRAPGAVRVEFGGGSRDYAGNDFGNANRADVVKTRWEVVTPPERIDAGVPTALTLRAVVTNLGPAPEVDVTDTMTVTSHQQDCVVTPVRHAVTRRLRKGEPVTIDFPVTVTCEDPSNHFFVFGNVVTVDGGLVDPHSHDNAASTSVTIPVFDDSDLSVADPVLACPARTDVDVRFSCVGTAVIHNAGPYGATDAVATLRITAPRDCTVVDGAQRITGRLAVPVGGGVPVSQTWTIECADRSYHPIGLDIGVAVVHEHVEDHVPANDTVSTGDTVEVFEAADLSVTPPMRIACGARLPSISTFGCDVRVTVTNAGPATAVLTETTTTLTAPLDCAVAPANATLPATLDSGQSETLTFHFDVTCTEPVLHSLRATAAIAAAEPHAEDRDLSNNTRRVLWAPTDAKPRSEPSSVNVGKEGVVPVAILSTPEFNAFAEVDQSTLRWGVTGFEASLVSCGGSAEDTNGDGHPDLVCRFDTRIAGITCDTSSATLTGYLKDGTPLESQDPVKVVGCRK